MGTLILILSLLPWVILIIAAGCYAHTNSRWKRAYEQLSKDYHEVHDIVRDELDADLREMVRVKLDRMKAVVSKANVDRLEGKTVKGYEAAGDWIADSALAEYDRLSKNLHGDVVEAVENANTEAAHELQTLVWGALQQYKEKHDETYIIHPRGTRLAYTQGNRTVILIEQEPGIRRTLFAPNTKWDRGKYPDTQQGYKQYQLAYPYVYYFLIADGGVVNTLSVYFANEPVRNSKSMLYLLPMPNVDTDGRGAGNSFICLGHDSSAKIGDASQSIHEQCEHAINVFWRQAFGHHGTYSAGKTGCTHLASPKKWEKESERDPLFVLQVSWRNGHNIHDVINRCMKSRGKSSMDGCSLSVQGLLEKHVKTLQKELKAITKKKRQDAAKEKVRSRVVVGVPNTVRGFVTTHVDECLREFRADIERPEDISELVKSMRGKGQKTGVGGVLYCGPKSKKKS